MLILEDLYLGDMRPGERMFKRNSQYAKALDKTVKAGDALTAFLSEEQKELFKELYDGPAGDQCTDRLRDVLLSLQARSEDYSGCSDGWANERNLNWKSGGTKNDLFHRRLFLPVTRTTKKHRHRFEV